MSATYSPNNEAGDQQSTIKKRGDRPPALPLGDDQRNTVDGEGRYMNGAAADIARARLVRGRGIVIRTGQS